MIMEVGRGVTRWEVHAPRGLSPSSPVDAQNQWGDMRPRDSATRFE